MTEQNQALAEAVQYEEGIAAEAAQIRGDEDRLTPALFRSLWPLLCRPIPAAYIVTEPAVRGKPYESTGIKSVQVQVDRMNNVLTPLWWWYVDRYEKEGRVCEVTVYVGNLHATSEEVQRWGERDAVPLEQGVLVSRRSRGGVEQGSSSGNLYKGSFTNAAKLALARLGVGREVYVGTADFDPDVNVGAAVADTEPAKAGTKIAKQLVDRAWDLGLKDKLQLAVTHVVQRDVGDCSTKAKATPIIAGLTTDEADRLDSWLTRKGQEQEEAQSKGSKGQQKLA
jgi:hypothetical protein